ncbi:MAG TPA: hypothetical protein VJ418_32480, partial [Streptosporangiaceae bacterium]|nr:hypothetical protein [Streptosporangiaceae bacterium]
MDGKIRGRISWAAAPTATAGMAATPFPLSAVTGFAGFFRRPASPWAWAALMAVNLAAVAAFLLSYSRHGVGFGPYRIDLGVYRIGGRTWLRGGDLYRQV